jgi:hypothetical protein
VSDHRPMDSSGTPLAIGDSVCWRGALYTIKEFGPKTGIRGTYTFVFEEPLECAGVPDEISVDRVDVDTAHNELTNAKWFDDRPRRTETCGRCGGCGTVELEYALAPTNRWIEAPDDAIRAFVVGSFDIFTACKEAADIAAVAHQPVAFQFNNQTVVVRPGDSPDAIARQWWQVEYNETPEQTMARR